MAKFKVDKSARYAKTHEWVRMEDGIATVGISDYAQDALSDVVFVDLPEIGELVTAGKMAATVESVKAASDVYAPLSGEIVEVNQAIVDDPAVVNAEPMGKGWFFKIRIADPKVLDALMDEAAYQKMIG